MCAETGRYLTIEITPAMIAAGAMRLCTFSDEFTSAEDGVREIVNAVFGGNLREGKFLFLPADRLGMDAKDLS